MITTTSLVVAIVVLLTSGNYSLVARLPGQSIVILASLFSQRMGTIRTIGRFL